MMLKQNRNQQILDSPEKTMRSKNIPKMFAIRLVCSLFLAVLLFIPIGRASLTDNLQSYWSFDTNFSDDVTTNDFTPMNATQILTGYVGTGKASFEPSTADWMQATATSINISTGDWTLNLWQQDNGSSFNCFVGGEANYELFGFEPRSAGSAIGYFADSNGVGGGSDTWDVVNGQYSYTPGVFNKPLFYSFQKNSTHFSLWINGTLREANAFVGDIYSTGNQIQCGRHWANANTFNGWIDEMSFYTRSLSTVEIENLYNDGQGFNPLTNVTPPVITGTDSQLFLNNTQQNLVTTQGESYSVYAYFVNDSAGIGALTRNGTPVTNGSIENPAVGFYNYTAFIPYNGSNIPSSQTYTVDVKPEPFSIVLYLNDSTINITIPETQSFYVYALGEYLLSIERNLTSIGNNSLHLLSDGYYNFTAIATDNFTEQRSTLYATVTDVPHTNSRLFLNNTEMNIVMREEDSVTVYALFENGSGTIKFTNGTMIGNNTELNLSDGSYTINASIAGIPDVQYGSDAVYTITVLNTIIPPAEPEPEEFGLLDIQSILPTVLSIIIICTLCFAFLALFNVGRFAK